MKTRGPNPNPTTQAQSKRCLSLSTKTQNIIKILPAGLPNPILFGTFFELFRRRCLKDPRPCPKAQKRYQDGGQRVPKWRPEGPNWSPEVPRSTKKTPTCIPHSKNVGATATLELQGHSQCPKNTTRPPKVVLMHWVRPQGARKTRTNRPRPGARRRRHRSAAPRQEVAGRARLVIRFLSKLGGEASPSLRWLRFCRRPLPSTTLHLHFSTL